LPGVHGANDVDGSSWTADQEVSLPQESVPRAHLFDCRDRVSYGSSNCLTDVRLMDRTWCTAIVIPTPAGPNPFLRALAPFFLRKDNASPPSPSLSGAGSPRPRSTTCGTTRMRGTSARRPPPTPSPPPRPSTRPNPRPPTRPSPRPIHRPGGSSVQPLTQLRGPGGGASLCLPCQHVCMHSEVQLFSTFRRSKGSGRGRGGGHPRLLRTIFNLGRKASKGLRQDTPRLDT